MSKTMTLQAIQTETIFLTAERTTLRAKRTKLNGKIQVVDARLLALRNMARRAEANVWSEVRPSKIKKGDRLLTNVKEAGTSVVLSVRRFKHNQHWAYEFKVFPSQWTGWDVLRFYANSTVRLVGDKI